MRSDNSSPDGFPFIAGFYEGDIAGKADVEAQIESYNALHPIA